MQADMVMRNEKYALTDELCYFAAYGTGNMHAFRARWICNMIGRPHFSALNLLNNSLKYLKGPKVAAPGAPIPSSV
jgi:hypothetical protein